MPEPARQSLLLHPRALCEAIGGIEVAVARRGPRTLALNYSLAGAVGALRLPPASTSSRADGLWRTTCFEAFLRSAPGEGYFEFNFSPSTQWAAYRFDGYRSGMTAVSEIAAPRIVARTGAGRFELDVTLDLDGLANGAAWRLGLSAVIEEADRRQSFWALAHPAGKPDFHHAAGFAYDLPAEEAR